VIVTTNEPAVTPAPATVVTAIAEEACWLLAAATSIGVDNIDVNCAAVNVGVVRPPVVTVVDEAYCVPEATLPTVTVPVPPVNAVVVSKVMLKILLADGM